MTQNKTHLRKLLMHLIQRYHLCNAPKIQQRILNKNLFLTNDNITQQSGCHNKLIEINVTMLSDVIMMSLLENE